MISMFSYGSYYLGVILDKQFYSIVFIPEVCLAVGLVILLLIYLYHDYEAVQHFYKDLSVLFGLLTWLYVFFIIYSEMFDYTLNGSAIYVLTLKSLIAFVATLWFRIVYWQHVFDVKRKSVRPQLSRLLPFFFGTCLLGLLLLITSNNLVLIYLCLELFSLSSCILMSTLIYPSKRLFFCLYYFIISALSSCLFLFGCAHIYGLSGCLDLEQIKLLFLITSDPDYNRALIIAIGFILLGLFMKAGIIPFHYWLLRLYSYLPYFTLFFFLIYSKLFVILLLIKIVESFICFQHWFAYLFFVVGLINVIGGSLLAVFQIRLKKLLICSSLTNTGYILLFVGLSLGDKDLLTYNLHFFLLGYWVAMLGLALILMICRIPYDIYQHQWREIVWITDLMYLPLTAKYLWSGFVLSLIGIPPFAGFWAKSLLLYLCTTFYHNVFAIVILLSSFLSLVYYLNLIKVVLFFYSASPVVRACQNVVYDLQAWNRQFPSMEYADYDPNDRLINLTWQRPVSLVELRPLFPFTTILRRISKKVVGITEGTDFAELMFKNLIPEKPVIYQRKIHPTMVGWLLQFFFIGHTPTTIRQKSRFSGKQVNRNFDEIKLHLQAWRNTSWPSPWGQYLKAWWTGVQPKDLSPIFFPSISLLGWSLLYFLFFWILYVFLYFPL